MSARKISIPRKEDIIEKRPGRKFKMLVVDDDQSILNFFARLFKNTVSISTALSGEDAIALASKTKYDLAFVDARLPGINGVEACKQLNKIDPDIIVIMMSGYDMGEQVKAAFELGAFEFLKKPLDVDELLTIPEAAKLLKMDKITLRRLAIRGDLPAMKFGRQWRIRQGKLQDWIKQKEVKRTA